MFYSISEMKTIGLYVLLAIFETFSSNAHNVKFSQVVSDVRVTSGKLDSTFINLDLSKNEIFKLKNSQNSIVFHFRSDSTFLKKVYLYRLRGLETFWNKCEGCVEAHYNHLDGGTYTFEIKAENDIEISEVKFTIEGKFWHEWWFVPMLFVYIVLLIGILAYIFAAFRLRLKLKEQFSIYTSKLNSMSELTSGIAHEIQNPLNFVNNFSEMSLEMAQELKDEVEKSNGDKEFILELTSDIFDNQKKIMFHGQRASDIVKRMLEHSNSIVGNFEITEIKNLIENQIIQSIQLFKRKNLECNVTYLLDADHNLPQLKIIKQGIIKIFINIFDNALYALRAKHQEYKNKNLVFDPIINISLGKTDTQVVIKIKDNGLGMGEEIKAKIFQPFFTTKPTGEGTGLGLSLAYDIVTKGHGGTIEVNSSEGNGSEFVIKLPIN